MTPDSGLEARRRRTVLWVVDLATLGLKPVRPGQNRADRPPDRRDRVCAALRAHPHRTRRHRCRDALWCMDMEKGEDIPSNFTH
jgi:hypothetical protein